MSEGIELIGVVDTREQDSPAGDFSSWLRRMRIALRQRHGSDVPCGACNACCRSSYFIHIGREELDTLARIPAELLFPAPGRPTGELVMGFDENGCCPMLVDGKCSIYADRPSTCRNYDCRVFAAAGIAAGVDKPEVTRRSRRWKFTYSDDRARVRHAAVQAAASYLLDHPECRPDGAPNNESQVAIFALEASDVFVNNSDDHAGTGREPSDREIAHDVRESLGQFGEKREATGSGSK